MPTYSVILLNNNRSKAYLQTLCAHGFSPHDAVVFHNGLINMPTKKPCIYSLNGFRASYNANESIFQTLEKEAVTYTVVTDMDPNSKDSEKAIAALKSDYVLYSGPTGILLKPNILKTGKFIIHAHPGVLPQFRGSTTIYYSLLLDNKAGCSIILLDEGIDSGTVLFSQKYDLNDVFLDYDVTVDTILRAETFLGLFEQTKGDLSSVVTQAQIGEPNTFFIIHPVLKHMAILKASGASETALKSLVEELSNYRRRDL